MATVCMLFYGVAGVPNGMQRPRNAEHYKRYLVLGILI